MFIRTDRLFLRPPWLCDAPEIVRLANNPAVSSRLGRMPHPYMLADAEHFLTEIVPREHVTALTLAESGQLIGMAGFTPHGAQWELGYWLGEAYWGHGYATEAGAALLDAAVFSHQRQAFTSAYFVDNPASGRVLAKLGFEPCGRSERPNLASGTNRTAQEMTLSAQRWLTRRRQAKLHARMPQVA